MGSFHTKRAPPRRAGGLAVKTVAKTGIIAAAADAGERTDRTGREMTKKPAEYRAGNEKEDLMLKSIPAALLAAALAFAAAPAAAQQQPVKGNDAVAIVQGGQIRASSSVGLQGFLLLIDYGGKNYTCAVAATGQVQTCYPLYW